MKCTICGHATMPGAMLCGPCRAALKRARYLSVQVAPPSSMMQGRPRRSRTQETASASPSAAGVLAAPAAASKRPARPLLRSLGLAATAMTALGVVAWLGQAPARDAAVRVESAAPATARVVNAGAPPADAGNIGARVVPSATHSVLLSASPADDGASLTPKPTRVQRVPPTPPPRTADSTLLSAGQAGVAYEMVPEPPRPAPIAPAPVPAPEPPPPDRWQTMRDDLARCDREGGFGGFICDQRVRLASCEGFWGRVPQCPLPPENPR